MTELDLRHSLIPEDLVDEMVNSMPQYEGSAHGNGDHSMLQYDYVRFMEKLMQGGNGGSYGHGPVDELSDAYCDSK